MAARLLNLQGRAGPAGCVFDIERFVCQDLRNAFIKDQNNPPIVRKRGITRARIIQVRRELVLLGNEPHGGIRRHIGLVQDLRDILRLFR